MDKITRLLLLYSKLIQGEKINKLTFCMEADCLPRSFDRDIEDIRLYLSELFRNEDLVYDRLENVYYFKGLQRQALETMEYLFVERVLLDTGALRYDEMDGLLTHLALNAVNTAKTEARETSSIKSYNEPLHKKAILKMHGDLTTTITKKSVIKINYIKINGQLVERELIPCALKFDLGHLYLIAFRSETDERYPAYFRLDRIYSFSIIRSQLKDERQRVDEYMDRYSQGITQMYGGEFTEIVVSCVKTFFPYVHDKFRNVKVVEEKPETMTVRLSAFDDGFVKWIISQPTAMIKVISPLEIKEKIANEANKLVAMYTEVLNNGEKD